MDNIVNVLCCLVCCLCYFQLKFQQGGFFIEAGAADGESYSNTLFLEIKRNWTGLLVEPDPIAYRMLKAKYRKSFSINSCIAKEVSKVNMTAAWLQGGFNKRKPDANRHAHPITVYCFPIDSILHAINQTTVDFFSLDVEGIEPQVLEAIPFDKVDIRLLSIEFNICGERPIRDVLEPVEYELVTKLRNDLIYRKKSVQ
ncbi:hypothetical protein ScPMuIL_010057 [Solemya velum]